ALDSAGEEANRPGDLSELAAETGDVSIPEAKQGAHEAGAVALRAAIDGRLGGGLDAVSAGLDGADNRGGARGEGGGDAVLGLLDPALLHDPVGNLLAHLDGSEDQGADAGGKSAHARSKGALDALPSSLDLLLELSEGPVAILITPEQPSNDERRERERSDEHQPRGEDEAREGQKAGREGRLDLVLPEGGEVEA